VSGGPRAAERKRTDLHDAHGRDEAGDGLHLRDRGADDERERPVDEDHDGPDGVPAAGRERRAVEHALDDRCAPPINM
jgi:hypothetical protein